MGNATAIPKENNGQLGTVEFLGKPLTVITTGSQLLVAMKPICEGIGLSWQSQYNRIQRDEVLSKGVVVMNTPSAGGEQRTICLPLNLLNGWLFGVDSKRCKPFIRQALVRYKFECYDALAAYWQKHAPAAPAELPPSDQLERFDHSFQGRRIEFLVGDGQVWCKASGIAAALGLGSSDRITRGLPASNKLTRVRGRQRHIYIDAAAAQRAGDYVRDANKAKAWADWVAKVLSELGRNQPANSYIGLDERTLACLYAMCAAGDRLVQAHQQLAPVHQAMRSSALLGVPAALEAVQVSVSHLREQLGAGMHAAAETTGLNNLCSSELLGVQLCSVLGVPMLPPTQTDTTPVEQPLQGELLGATQLTPVQRYGLGEIMDMRFMVAFDEAAKVQVKVIAKDAVVVPLAKLPDIIADPFTLNAGQLAGVMDAVTGRMKTMFASQRR